MSLSASAPLSPAVVSRIAEIFPAEERRLLAVAEGHAEIDELDEPAGSGRWPDRAGRRPGRRPSGSTPGAGERGVKPAISSRGLAVPASASSETTALTLPRSGEVEANRSAP